MWALFRKANKAECVPVLIAPYIHGSCFQLFKKMGMFGRSTYSVVLSAEFNGALEFNLSLEAKDIPFIKEILFNDRTVLINGASDSKSAIFKWLNFGNFMDPGSFLDIENEPIGELLSKTIPNHYARFSANFQAASIRIMPLLDGDLNYLVSEGKAACDHRDSVERIDRLLKLMKFAGVVEIRKMVARAKEWMQN